MRGRRVRRGFVALFLLFTLVLPALAVPVGARPGVLQAVTSTSQGPCFGYNQVNDSLIPQAIRSLRVALVQPIFTSTPYSQYPTGSFYAFYAKYKGVTTNVTTDLNWLSTNVSSGYNFNGGWGLSAGFNAFFRSQTAANCGLVVGRNVQILTDMNVSQGAFFDPESHAARYDVVVLPFSEYVTVQEYLAYVDFVAGGGTLVMMSHSLEYPVTYDSTTNMESLVYSHGWAFHGTYASPSPCSSNSYNLCPWAKNNTNWAGNNMCQASCYHTYRYNGSVVNGGNPIGKALLNEFGSVVFKSYKAHEENSITNMTGTSVVSVFVNDSKNLIAPYTHQYKKGVVVGMSVFGDDIIATDPSAQYFLLLGIASAKSGFFPQPTATASSTTSSTSSTTSVSSPSTPSTSTSTYTTHYTAGKIPTSQSSQSSGTDSVSLILAAGISAIVLVAAAVIVRQRRGMPGG